MSEQELTHIDENGRARMVDVSDKAVTARRAMAAGRLVMSSETLKLALSGGHKKGDVIAVAEIAGVMAAKKCGDLIPMCHPLPITSAKVEVTPDYDEVALKVTAVVTTNGQTGVEMEAMTAVSVACLTLYDMLKSSDKSMIVEQVRLLEKDGGKSGSWRAPINGS